MRMPTRNNKMAINNSNNVGNTKDVRLDLIFFVFHTIKGIKMSRLEG
jgi:hypothetical protein